MLTALQRPGSRDGVGDALAARRDDPTPCLVGLDFAFGFPAWFADASGWRTIDDVWQAAADHGEQWLASCTPPFWGRTGKRRAHDADRGLRNTERDWATSQQPKSTLQIGGAGSVGTGSVRGMPLLRSLRRSGWSIWPFDPPGTHTAVEIYPRLFTGAVIKSRDATRLAHLDRYPGLPSAMRDAMARSEDAFDAGMSALAMSCAVSGGVAWPTCDAAAGIEGQIWVPGASRGVAGAGAP